MGRGGGSHLMQQDGVIMLLHAVTALGSRSFRLLLASRQKLFCHRSSHFCALVEVSRGREQGKTPQPPEVFFLQGW